MEATGLRLGIDVGGTNTDAVLMRGSEVIAALKSFTTPDVRDGVIAVVRGLLGDGGVRPQDIRAVMIGTTQFINAFVQRRSLARVAAIRVCLPTGDGIPPFAGWPEDARAAVDGRSYLVRGGAFVNGQDFAPLDEEAVTAAALDAAKAGISAFAVSATFSPIRPDIEQRAAALIAAAVPGARVTCSATLGGLSLIDRENATIINASLSDLAVSVVRSLERAFEDLAIHAPLFISQNDGTLIDTASAARFPILTCSAGPTNSIRGAALLSGLSDAIVADMGGTTTDIGFLKNGFPRESSTASDVGGVRTNFRMPDVLSIGVGGGSIVRDEAGGIAIGPQSVGYRLQQEGLVFGGQVLTTTDIAVRSGAAAIGDPSCVAHLPEDLVARARDEIHRRIEEAIDQVKVSAAPQPLILVGGGSILVSRDLKGTSQTVRPPHAEVANAVGAAIALASGRVDRMFDFGELGREAGLAQARAEAVAAAVAAGAVADQTEIVDLQELPMTHMQTSLVQVKARAVGPLAIAG